MTIGTPETVKFFSHDAAKAGLEMVIRPRIAMACFILRNPVVGEGFQLLAASECRPFSSVG